MSENTDKSKTRRTVLKTLGAGAAVAGAGTIPSKVIARDPEIVRVKGSHRSPVRPQQVEAAVRRAAAKTRNIDSALDDFAVPEAGAGGEKVDGSAKNVEYVGKLSPDGTVRGFWGAAIESQVDSARANADDAAQRFRSAVSPNVVSDVGPDWTYVKDDQATVSGHWGEMKHNFEWYRERTSSEERNAFQSIIFNSDDTINPYGRDTYATHDWSVSELGNEAVHDAAPDSSDDPGTSVSIGIPPELSLGWEIGGSGDINLDLFGVTADWSYSAPTDGTMKSVPGSHVTADPANCTSDQDVVQLDAKARWGGLVAVYKLTHTWNVFTRTC